MQFKIPKRSIRPYIEFDENNFVFYSFLESFYVQVFLCVFVVFISSPRLVSNQRNFFSPSRAHARFPTRLRASISSVLPSFLSSFLPSFLPSILYTFVDIYQRRRLRSSRCDVSAAAAKTKEKTSLGSAVRMAAPPSTDCTG